MPSLCSLKMLHNKTVVANKSKTSVCIVNYTIKILCQPYSAAPDFF